MHVLIVGMLNEVTFILQNLDQRNVHVQGIISPEGPWLDHFTLNFAGGYIVYPYELMQQTLLDVYYDYVICREDYVNDIAQYGVSKKKILNCTMMFNYPWYYTDYLYRFKQFDELNKTKKLHNYKVLILGTSYAERGCHVEYFRLPAISLARPNMDFYYSLQILKRMAAYKDFALEYLVFQISPYCFHFNPSRGNDPFYTIWRFMVGLGDTHDYFLSAAEFRGMFNDNFRDACQKSVEEILSKPYDFNVIGGHTDMKIDTKARMSNVKSVEAWNRKYYPVTKSENIGYLKETLKLCKAKRITPILLMYPHTPISVKIFNKRILNETRCLIE